jgi:hypothetical protein
MSPCARWLAAPLLLFALAGSGRTDAPVLVRMEAERWSAQGGGEVQVLDRPEASGGKTVSYWESPGVWLEVRLDLPQAGAYRLSLRYALSWPDTRRQVLLDGQPVGEITLPGTDGWGTFATLTTPLRLPALAAGPHTLRLLNADSRGLSLDWIALHSEGVFIADRPLGPEEYAALLAHFRPSPPAAYLQAGEVRVEFGADGQARLAQIGDVVLGAELPAGPALPVRLLTVGSLRAAVCGEAKQLTVWVTEGRNLYVARRADDSRPLRLPGPVAGPERLRLVTGRTGAGEGLSFAPGEPTRDVEHLLMGGLHLTTSPALRLGPWGDPVHGAPTAELPLQPTSAGCVGAARLSRRWGADEPAISVGVAGTKVTVREAAHRYPTLALFYGEGLFDLEFTRTGAMFTEAASGARVTLP